MEVRLKATKVSQILAGWNLTRLSLCRKFITHVIKSRHRRRRCRWANLISAANCISESSENQKNDIDHHRPKMESFYYYYRPLSLYRGDWNWTDRQLRVSRAILGLLMPSPLSYLKFTWTGDRQWMVVLDWLCYPALNRMGTDGVYSICRMTHRIYKNANWRNKLSSNLTTYRPPVLQPTDQQAARQTQRPTQLSLWLARDVTWNFNKRNSTYN